MSATMETTEPPHRLLVTQSQLSQGYFERSGFIGWHRKFQVIMDHGDGTITVVNPEWERWRMAK